MQCISTRKALQAFIVCAWSSVAAGGAFTNHVGHVVCGSLTSVTNGFAVIEGRRYPMSIFPETEQARMRRLVRAPSPLPLPLAARRRSIRERWLRNEALLAAGAKSEEAAEAMRQRLRAAWRRMLREADIDPATRDYWLPRIP